MAAKITDNGLAIVKAFEGCLKPEPKRPGYFRPYYCPAGVLTIGWGHTNHHEPKFAATALWTQQKCDDVLRQDMGVFEARVAKIMGDTPLTYFERDALISFDYNTGGLDRSSIPAKIKSNRRGQVAATLALWNKANGKVLNGLTRRRAAEGQLFDGRIDLALKTAGAIRPETGPMPQRVDRPTPPVSEAVRQTKGTTAGTIVAGTAGAGAAANKQDGVPVGISPAIAIGIAIAVLAGIALIVWRKHRQIDADYA